MDNSIFRSLTRGVTFKRPKKNPPKVDSNCDEDENRFNGFKTDNFIKKEENSEGEEISDDEVEEVPVSPPVKKRKKMSEGFIKQKQIEDTVKLRKIHNINVKGSVESVKPVETFDELFERYPLNEKLKENIQSFNYKQPTPVQMQVLPLFLENLQVKVCAPTGSGKTLAFAAPLIQNIINLRSTSPNTTNQIQAIILVPTRELASQILSVTTRLCIDTDVRAHIITSTNDDHMKNFSKKKTNILISTPLKLVYFIKSEAMTLSHVKWIVIDEVDKLFEESNQSFSEDVDEILAACSNEDRKFALFSATTTKEMTPFVHENLKNFATVNISPNTATSTVDQELKFVGVESAKLLAIRDIFRQGVSPPVLIFLQSKDRAKQLFSELMFDGINIDVIHSDRSQKEREEVYKKFREGKIWVLICTELMSRGIDFRDVSMVINFDLPTSTYSYIHRIGRCGRGNKRGKAITFYTNDDQKGILRDIARLVSKSGSHVEGFLLQLKKSSKKERVALLKKAPKRKNFSTKVASDKKGSKKKWRKKAKKTDE